MVITSEIRIASLATLLLLLGLSLTHAQKPDFESKEMRMLKLRLSEAELQVEQGEARLKKAEADHKEAQQLFQQGLYSKADIALVEEELRQADLALKHGRIGLEKTRLGFLNDASHVTLEKAALYRDSEGQKRVLLMLRNTSNLGRILDSEGRYTEEAKRSLLQIEDLKVRILFEEKLIGSPFEIVIPKLRHGERTRVDFALQRETDAVTVEMAYGDSVAQLPVYLETEAGEDKVIVEALQFSQEGELGTRIAYDLELERLADDNATFSLEVANLPREYTYEFAERDPEDKEAEDTRVSRIRFKKGTTQKSVRFSINIPKELPSEALNKKASFHVLVLDRFATQRLASLKEESQGRSLQGEDLDSAKLSYETLELIPRGRAELTLSATNLFYKVKLGEIVRFRFKLSNTGTVPLQNARVKLGLPLDWSAQASPEKDIALEVLADRQVEVEVVPATDVVVGDYEVKVEAFTLHEGRDVRGVPKTVRIQVEGKSNLLLGSVFMLALVGMVVGVAVMTIRISRR